MLSWHPENEGPQNYWVFENSCHPCCQKVVESVSICQGERGSTGTMETLAVCNLTVWGALTAGHWGLTQSWVWGFLGRSCVRPEW